MPTALCGCAVGVVMREQLEAQLACRLARFLRGVERSPDVDGAAIVANARDPPAILAEIDAAVAAGVVRVEARPVLGVLLQRDQPEVVGVDAATVVADVINHEVRRQGPDLLCQREPMNTLHPAFVPQSGIPAICVPSVPKPTPGFVPDSSGLDALSESEVAGCVLVLLHVFVLLGKAEGPPPRAGLPALGISER